MSRLNSSNHVAAPVPPDPSAPPKFPDDPIDITKAAELIGVHVASLHRWRLKG